MQHWLPPVLNGTLREHYILLFGAAGAFSLMVGGMSALLGAWIGARRASQRALQESRDAAQLAQSQLATLTQSVEAIALEVERISEAQRFATRLLTERPASSPIPAPRREPGIITPH